MPSKPSLWQLAKNKEEKVAVACFRMTDLVGTLGATDQMTADNLEAHFNELKVYVGAEAFDTAWRVIKRISAADKAAEAGKAPRKAVQ
jgi:hypothetical protein